MTVATLFAAASCSDKEDQTPEESFAVVSADVAYSPAGGTGVVIVNSREGIKATSNREEWCHVSVNGATVSVEVDPQTSMQSRYSIITVTKGNSKVSVTIQQMGNFLSGEFPSTITLDCEASEKSYPFSANGDLVLTPSEDWITASVKDGKMVLNIARNEESRTRLGKVTYALGENSGEFNIVQYPEFKEYDGWAVTYDGDETVSGAVKSIVKNTVSSAAGKYVFAVVDKSIFTKYGASQSVFVRDSLVKYNMDVFKGKDDISDLLYGEETNQIYVYPELSMGSYYLYSVGFDADGYPTGLYSVAEVLIPMKPYDRWIGKWTVHGHVLNEDESNDRDLYTITISADVKGETYNISGWPGPDVNIPAVFDASTGGLTLVGNRNSSDAAQGRLATNVTYDGVTYAGIYVVGRALKANGSWTYFTGKNYPIAYLKLTNDEYTEATATPRSGTTSGVAYTFRQLQVVGVKSGSTSVYNLANSEIAIFPFTMKKK